MAGFQFAHLRHHGVIGHRKREDAPRARSLVLNAHEQPAHGVESVDAVQRKPGGRSQPLHPPRMQINCADPFGVRDVRGALSGVQRDSVGVGQAVTGREPDPQRVSETAQAINAPAAAVRQKDRPGPRHDEVVEQVRGERIGREVPPAQRSGAQIDGQQRRAR